MHGALAHEAKRDSTEMVEWLSATNDGQDSEKPSKFVVSGMAAYGWSAITCK